MNQAEELLREALQELKLEYDEIGGCDHSVGSCACGLADLITRIELYLNPKENTKCKHVWKYDRNVYFEQCMGFRCQKCGETCCMCDIEEEFGKHYSIWTREDRKKFGLEYYEN